jgi:ADP-ribosylglycohydrolase
MGSNKEQQVMTMEAKFDLQQRYRGALMGLAVGDAFGTTLEFKPPGTFEPITDMVGGGPFELAAGEWTDDTSMALCLATSLIECKGFNPNDQMKRYVRWWKDGYLSVTGSCFDVGSTVVSALTRFSHDGNAYAGATNPDTAGNGSLMRLAPVPLFFAAEPKLAIEQAAESSRTTHGAESAVDACRYFSGLIVGTLRGAGKETLLSPRYSPEPGYWERSPLHPKIDEVASGSFKKRQPPEIRGTGYVVESLEAALWAFHSTNDFRSGCLAAANLGNDADTTAAIYGQLAGAYYGIEAIPSQWREQIAQRNLVESLADRLFELRPQKTPA